MRYIDLTQINVDDPAFKEWLRDARQKLSELRNLPSHEARAAYLKSHGIWSDLKPILETICGKKCWYSECHMHGDFGDVDHFRPKNKSLDLSGQTILADGYWWLAYDYTNYRLSCAKCNRGSGKRDYFPIKPGFLPVLQGETASEEHLLLDPCKKHDTELVGFNENGQVIPLTNDPWEIERVIQSRKIYQLDEFNDARRKVRCQCQIGLMIFERLYEVNPELIKPTLELLLQLTSDDAPYSSTAKQYIAYQIEGKPYAQDLGRILKIPALPNTGNEPEIRMTVQAV